MKLKRRHVKRGRVEVIPMIDTILILLIFYMSFSTFTKKEKRIDAKLPLVAKAGIPSNKIVMDLTLHVKDKNNIMVNGQAGYDSETVRNAMMSFSAIGQEATIVIEGEPDTPYQAVVSVLDACAQAKLEKVAFRPLPEKADAAPAAP